MCNVHHPPHCAAASSGASPPMHLPRIGCRAHCCGSAAAANTIGNNCTKCIFQCNFTLHCMLSNNKATFAKEGNTCTLAYNNHGNNCTKVHLSVQFYTAVNKVNNKQKGKQKLEKYATTIALSLATITPSA